MSEQRMNFPALVRQIDLEGLQIVISPLKEKAGDPNGIRTRAFTVKG